MFSPERPSTAHNPDTYRKQPQASRFLILGLLLLGFALRLHELGGESLWYDETVSAYLANQSVMELIAHTARDIHPPAYYLLLHGWRLLARPSVAFGLEFLFAWPSLWLSMLVMALTYSVACENFGKKTGLWALALALLHPVQIWFSQEVRMYALGGVCLLLTLWAVTPLLRDSAPAERSGKLPSRTRFLYPIAALLGLYTLYYFALWLIVLNIAVALHFWRKVQGKSWDNHQSIRRWIALQLFVIAGYLPWLPTLIRQALTPPVPAWRESWQSGAEIAQAVIEGIAAYWVGHAPPLAANLPAAMLVALTAAAFYVYAKSLLRLARVLWLILCFGPLTLLLAASLFGPPIYHVRYVATYAPLFSLLAAALIVHLNLRFALPLFSVFTVVALSSIYQLWTSPTHAADDHRSAVAELARQWRPGDVIMVNAGWVYTALSLYWPTELPSPDAARPKAIAGIHRLQPDNTLGNVDVDAPLILLTGSINGDPDLGWGLPESDFFAISEEQTEVALEQVAATSSRIWHYRLYDTVSDPSGFIRAWLEANTTPVFHQPIPGRDFLLLEAYQTGTAITPTTAITTNLEVPDAGIRLAAYAIPSALPAGETLYAGFTWERLSEEAPPAQLALSLRLYDKDGALVSQSDSTITSEQTGTFHQWLALPIPADTIPVAHTLAFVLYAPETLIPFEITTAHGEPSNEPFKLGEVTIELPATLPHTGAPVARFDYIDLLKVELPASPLPPGGTFNAAWTWRPRASQYRDHYQATLALIGEQPEAIVLHTFDLGGSSYPSSQWQTNYPLRQRTTTTLPGDLSPGRYQLQLTITRAADGHPIPARRSGLLPGQQPAVIVGHLIIE